MSKVPEEDEEAVGGAVPVVMMGDGDRGAEMV
jgi:hypothetical protein